MQQLNVPLGENIWDCMRSVHAKFNKFRKHIGGIAYMKDIVL
jgi:hypothetical protein